MNRNKIIPLITLSALCIVALISRNFLPSEGNEESPDHTKTSDKYVAIEKSEQTETNTPPDSPTLEPSAGTSGLISTHHTGAILVDFDSQIEGDLRTERRLYQIESKHPYVVEVREFNGEELISEYAYVANKLIVGILEEETGDDFENWLNSENYAVDHRSFTGRRLLVRSDNISLDTIAKMDESFKTAYSEEIASGAVSSAKNYLVFPSFTPNDPSYTQTWGLFTRSKPTRRGTSKPALNPLSSLF